VEIHQEVHWGAGSVHTLIMNVPNVCSDTGPTLRVISEQPITVTSTIITF
jgi:hypothetical protein